MEVVASMIQDDLAKSLLSTCGFGCVSFININWNAIQLF